MDCGATCLRMVAKYHGRHYPIQFLREISFVDREGASLLSISDAAEKIGFNTLAAKISMPKLLEMGKELPLPAIVHWRQNHYIVIYEIKKKKIRVADPKAGVFWLSIEEFKQGFVSDRSGGEDEGVILFLEATPDFFARDEEKTDKSGFRFLFSYIFKYKKLLFQLLLGLLLGSILQLIFPFLMQAIVDYGINNEDISFILLIAIAHGVLFFSYTIAETIRGFILLHIGARVNISLISDFLMKMMRLPVRFFDTKLIGDLLQRIQDHYRIENFLTATSLNTLFSIVSLFVFSVVLFFYSIKIFLIFIVGAIVYFIWISVWLNARRKLDYRKFDQLSGNRTKLIELISGIEELKLHGAEKQKRWEWERIQVKLFRLNLSSLRIDQFQLAGGRAINEIKNITISVIAAIAVVEQEMSLGMMLAVQYIIGQTNAPLLQLIDFLRSGQDAKISLERLGEIHNREDEDSLEQTTVDMLPEKGDLNLENVSFQYGGPHSAMVLKNINLKIPEGKVTAIVGMSGSGKTTLLKLLLKFYEPTGGAVKLDEINLKNISNKVWRRKCGVVMQEGYIFSDTIAENIALGDEIINKQKLLRAVKTANIQKDIESLPLGYNTKVGMEGGGLSQGQKQRLLIARAIYKNPEYIFFDEATNSLDANNEKEIMEKLDQFFEGRTVVVVAHRLSTVKNADQIIVLDKGEIIEQGTHEELVALKGAYFKLVKNQLELGN